MIKPKEHLKDIKRTPLGDEPPRLGKIRLDRNERNQSFSPALMERIRLRLTDQLLMTYPECQPVHRKVAAHIGVPEDWLQLHMGSEQAIKLVFETYIKPGDRVLLHLPGYAMYPVFARLFQAKVESQSYGFELNFDWDEFIGRISPGLRMVVVENPNGLLGKPITMETLTRLLAHAAACGALVVVDEAYHLFHSATALPLLQQFDNLIITRSFSKAFGLAGLRAGCLVSRPENIAGLFSFKPAYELTSVTAMVLEEMLDHPAEYQGFARETAESLAEFKAGIEALGFQASDSVANFMTVRIGRELAEQWRVALAREDILIRRPFREPYLNEWVRISTASAEVLRHVIEVLRGLLAEQRNRSR